MVLSRLPTRCYDTCPIAHTIRPPGREGPWRLRYGWCMIVTLLYFTLVWNCTSNDMPNRPDNILLAPVLVWATAQHRDYRDRLLTHSGQAAYLAASTAMDVILGSPAKVK